MPVESLAKDCMHSFQGKLFRRGATCYSFVNERRSPQQRPLKNGGSTGDLKGKNVTQSGQEPPEKGRRTPDVSGTSGAPREPGEHPDGAESASLASAPKATLRHRQTVSSTECLKRTGKFRPVL